MENKHGGCTTGPILATGFSEETTGIVLSINTILKSN